MLSPETQRLQHHLQSQVSLDIDLVIIIRLVHLLLEQHHHFGELQIILIFGDEILEHLKL